MNYLFLYSFGGFGGPLAAFVAFAALVALVALVGGWPRGRIARVALALMWVPILVVGSVLIADLLAMITDIGSLIYPHDPGLCVHAGLALLTALLALRAAIRPAHPALQGAGALALLATLAWYGWMTAEVRESMIDAIFWEEGGTLVRAYLDGMSQRLALGFERELVAQVIAALAILVAAPLLAVARVRSRTDGRPWGWKALACATAALPLITLGKATLVQATSTVSNSVCAPMTPIDPSPRMEWQWALRAELEVEVVVAGLLAAALGSLAALRAARAGHVASNRGLLGALAIFLLGGGLYVGTRVYAEDTTDGPRRAFVGAPFQPYGERASDWLFADFVAPPTASIACPFYQSVDDTVVVPLEINAAGERVVPFDDLGLAPRGVAAWEHELPRGRYSAFHELPSQTIYIGAAIDHRAPLVRVLPYLEAAAARGVHGVHLFSRRSIVESTQTLGDVRVDKVCVLGSLPLDRVLSLGEHIGTWGELARVAAALAPEPLVLRSSRE
jgi:hypothetical protein